MEVLRSYETSGSSHPTHNVTVRHYEILQVLSTTYSPLFPHLCQLNPTPNHTPISVLFLVFRPKWVIYVLSCSGISHLDLGRIILKSVFKIIWEEGGMDLFSSKWGPLACCCGHGTEPSGSVEFGEFLD